jgi:uncharacterized protein YbcV (DUF1398 family)
MDAQHIAIATACLHATHDGSLAFPAIVEKLLAAGFEGYAVDYRRQTQIFYLPDGDAVELAMPDPIGAVAAQFCGAQVAAAVRWAQANGPDYHYAGFCEKVTAAGCAGYLVSFTGRRVVYYGRTAETHVEHFPS